MAERSGGRAAGTNVRTVFAGLMVGMLVAAVAQTIIARLRALITREAEGRPPPCSPPADLETLERIGVVAGAALLLDLRGGDGDTGRG